MSLTELSLAGNNQIIPRQELIVLVDFNFHLGLEDPGVYLPCGLVSLGYPRVY